MLTVRKFQFGDLRQHLAVADITRDTGRLCRTLPDRVALMYSDPPWNQGNEKYWRRLAGAAQSGGYERLLNSWKLIARECVRRGAAHIFCEQSANEAHRRQFLTNWDRPTAALPLLEEWTVYYGTRARPNALLHFGHERLAADPGGMHGESMSIRVFSGLRLRLQPAVWCCDPCAGRGMTSRLCHYFGLNFWGLEINGRRLAHACDWLKRYGYVES